MDKASKYLEAKQQFMMSNDDPSRQKKNKFSGKKLAYGVTILNLVIKDLGMNIELKDLVDASVDKKDDLDRNSLKIAKKNLQKVFKDWFKSGNTPLNLMPKYTDQLNYPQELKEYALIIV